MQRQQSISNALHKDDHYHKKIQYAKNSDEIHNAPIIQSDIQSAESRCSQQRSQRPFILYIRQIRRSDRCAYIQYSSGRIFFWMTCAKNKFIPERAKIRFWTKSAPNPIHIQRLQIWWMSNASKSNHFWNVPSPDEIPVVSRFNWCQDAWKCRSAQIRSTIWCTKIESIRNSSTFLPGQEIQLHILRVNQKDKKNWQNLKRTNPSQSTRFPPDQHSVNAMRSEIQGPTTLTGTSRKLNASLRATTLSSNFCWNSLSKREWQSALWQVSTSAT